VCKLFQFKVKTVAKEKFKVNIKTGSSAQHLLLRIILFPSKKFLNGRADYPPLSQTLHCAIYIRDDPFNCQHDTLLVINFNKISGGASNFFITKIKNVFEKQSKHGLLHQIIRARTIYFKEIKSS
jgi:hypothetical protein